MPRFREIFDIVEAYVEHRWGIPIVVRDVPSPFTGDLDGAEIHVDYDLEAEDALFILAHLFGHTVQWNTSAEARRLGAIQGSGHPPEVVEQLVSYEREACRYSLQLLHAAGIRDLDQWLADFAACDLAYLTEFYRTGQKAGFRSFWRSGQPLLEPLPIPDFRPTRWVSRWEGIVI
jgi:hypothetical protein